jgi:methyl-accepting chemotaxis protein
MDMVNSVIVRMYAGFALIVCLFIATVTIMLSGTKHINYQLQTVTSTSFPLVTISNQTTVKLLATDKAFKDFLTSRDPSRMASHRDSFIDAQQQYLSSFIQLQTITIGNEVLNDKVTLLSSIEQRYVEQAQVAMENYQRLILAGDNVQTASRQFQQLHTQLKIQMEEYIEKQDNVAVKFMAKSYFAKLKDAEDVTSDALASSDLLSVQQAVKNNKRAVTQLRYAYRSLVSQLPELKPIFDKNVEKFALDVGKKGGVLNAHADYLDAQNLLYANIASLAADINEALQLLGSFNAVANQTMSESLSKADRIYEQATLRAFVLGLVVSLFAIGIGYHLAHSVRSPITGILRALEDLTNGDMTRRIETKKKSEFTKIAIHINTLSDHLQRILNDINAGSDQLIDVSSTNSTITEKANQRLDEQREKTTLAATAMTQMQHSVTEIAHSSQHSLDKVKAVEKAADSGRQIMSANIVTISQLSTRLDESVDAVNVLQQVSSDIGSILDVIRGIAEQTNLLALNAAIEAARAGEQGRGFAVVADEVRVLAQKTANSTSEIESMIHSLQTSSKTTSSVIQSCVNEMSQSVTQASNANHSMEEIQSLIIEISHMSSHISQAADEQSVTSSDIAQNLEEISHIADLNYEAMNKISGISLRLNQQANQQNELVHRFTL